MGNVCTCFEGPVATLVAATTPPKHNTDENHALEGSTSFGSEAASPLTPRDISSFAPHYDIPLTPRDSSPLPHRENYIQYTQQTSSTNSEDSHW